MSSRRVYVHAHSLKQVCLSDRKAGEEIIAAMIGVGVKKRLFNRLVQDGQMLLGLDEETLVPVRMRIGDLDGTNLSRTLRRVHFQPALNGKTRQGTPWTPLFGADEEVVASCFDDNYYTFATDWDAADRMYADHVPIKDLRQLLAQQPEDPRVADLTLVRGNRLSLTAVAPGSGADCAPHCERLTPRDLRHVAQSAQGKVSALTESLLSDLDRSLFPDAYLGLIRDNLLESIADAARPIWGSAH
ncbi:MAG: hypothetical protein H6898_07320 [Rhodobacter sp.]|nr:hypothetical protein [Paracoccaceae bacterium]MCC0076384.1 hypothetical protein [Rhodobacter sp.]